MSFFLFDLETWEMWSYVVTVFGLPLAIGVFLFEQRRERQGEEEEIFQYLSEEYAEFQKLILENADLGLTTDAARQLDADQIERQHILYDILISLFERAYILVYEDKMDKQTRRLWASWEDYMDSWCRRADFRAMLPELLSGEDPDFVAYMLSRAAQVA
ncbi:MAG TPA: hypothetical protein VGF14_06885 [Alphaproteobacteria bacterium]